MATGLKFTDDVRLAMEKGYLTPEVIETRNTVSSILNVSSGDAVLDIGSGPGLLSYKLAQQVGENGSLQGIDIAENMVEDATQRCAEMAWSKFDVGEATSLPYPDAHFDKVVSTQVFEYVDDLDQSVDEFARVLKPNGKGVIVDTDWDAVYWSSTNNKLRDQIIQIWSDHCAQTATPMRLSHSISSAKLSLDRIHVLPLLNTRYDENNFSYWVSTIIAAYCVGSTQLTESETQQWLGDLKALHENGDYFFCLNRYLFEVTKP